MKYLSIVCLIGFLGASVFSEEIKPGQTFPKSEPTEASKLFAQLEALPVDKRKDEIKAWVKQHSVNLDQISECIHAMWVNAVHEKEWRMDHDPEVARAAMQKLNAELTTVKNALAEKSQELDALKAKK